MSTKTYVIDTNVLVHDYNSFTKILKGNKIIIPYVVLEELDRLKTKSDQVGVNARNVIKLIEKELIENNPNVTIIPTDKTIEVPDDRIIEVCLRNEINGKIILVSKDVCLRTKARAMGIKVEDYKDDKVKIDDLYSGIKEICVSPNIIDKFYDEGVISWEGDFYPNQSVVFIDETQHKNKAIGIYKNKEFIKLIDNKVEPFGLKCANLEQRILTNLLLDDDIKLVTVTGLAGSGKTLTTIACGLEAVIERNNYKKLTVARPIMPFQKDIGYLPGNIDEKLNPWFGSIIDNLEFLFADVERELYKGKNKTNVRMSPFEELQSFGVLEMLPLTFIRGRSLPYQYIVIDECQNISNAEVKSILTRAGKNSKVILTGDYSQIDTPFLSPDSNGLVYCVEKFKDQSIAAHITLSKCERSDLADISSKIL